jgi:tRNA(adenine34) deaminase
MITEYYYQNVIISAFSQKGSLYFMNNCQNSTLDAATEASLHNKFMKEAIRQARKAAKLDEVPIGCVITYEDRIIARGYNRRNTDKSTLAHAEIAAIKKASKVIGDWRLEECTLYVTLEPCQMCAGAIVQARIPRVVIGTMNAKAGCAGSVYNLLQEPKFNHQVDVIYDVLREECTQMLTSFFIQLRQKHKEAKQKAAQELQ